jgi:Helicase associated domain
MWDKVYDPHHILKMRIFAAAQASMRVNGIAYTSELVRAQVAYTSDLVRAQVAYDALPDTFAMRTSRTFAHSLRATKLDTQNLRSENSEINGDEIKFTKLPSFETRPKLEFNTVNEKENSAHGRKFNDVEREPYLIPCHSRDCDTPNDPSFRSRLIVRAANKQSRCVSIPEKSIIAPEEYTNSKCVQPVGDNEVLNTDGDIRSSPKNSKDVKWIESYKELVAYKSQYGNCIVPRGFSLNPKLACWVAEQRKQYKLHVDGKHSPITPNRIQLLEGIGFAWNAHEAAWDKHFNDLRSFKDDHGDCKVPLMHPKYPKLGLWVKEQRRHFTLLKEGKESHMTQERIHKLNSLGFCWHTHKSTWNERFHELIQFKEQYGHCVVPLPFSPNPRLGTWVHQQRRQYRYYKEGCPCHMTPERIRCLDSIGFSWHSRKRARKHDVSHQLLIEDFSLTKETVTPAKRPRFYAT